MVLYSIFALIRQGIIKEEIECHLDKASYSLT